MIEIGCEVIKQSEGQVSMKPVCRESMTTERFETLYDSMARESRELLVAKARDG